MDTNVSTLISIGYAVYLPIALTLTYYVAHNLFKNSKVFMLDIFGGKDDIAMSTNRLFEIGFYLMNIGFAFMILKIRYFGGMDSQTLIELLSYKIGGFSIYLGIMLFFNMYLFFRGRRIAKSHRNKPSDTQGPIPYYDDLA